MRTHLHSEHKKEFQLERLILFSDAVFAIAITLLAIELKVPELPEGKITEELLIDGLARELPKLTGFLVSFFIIGLYWTVHHRMFGFVVNYTPRLLWLNLIFLLSVVLMPFSTAFYSAYIYMLLKTPAILYTCNICFLGIMNYVLWWYISKPRLGLIEGMDREMIRYFSFRALLVPIMFVVMLAVYLVAPLLAVYIPMLIPLVMYVVRKAFKR
jgi:uncharacterized membrane protein